jgi:hypothetical protein
MDEENTDIDIVYLDLDAWYDEDIEYPWLGDPSIQQDLSSSRNPITKW